jgi:hypothetical protein
MPSPVSMTVISTCESTSSSSTWTFPFMGVNLMVLLRRFQKNGCLCSRLMEKSPEY